MCDVPEDIVDICCAVSKKQKQKSINICLKSEILLKAPYGGNTADPHSLDALRDCYEQVWTGAAHGALGFDTNEEGMAGCGKSESRLIGFGTDPRCTLSFYVSKVYAEAVCNWHHVSV